MEGWCEGWEASEGVRGALGEVVRGGRRGTDGARRLVGMVTLSGEGEERRGGGSDLSGVLSSLDTPRGLGGGLPPSN